jgi:enamine deaminase RidA (YjgF/YER057c/UK114 family)
LFVSGQLPIDRDGNVVNGTMAEEATQENIVEAAKGSIEDIVRYDLH